MTLDEQIQIEVKCVNYLTHLIEKNANAGKYEQAHRHVESLERSIRELGRLEHLKKMEENLKKLLKANGVQIHHILHVMQTKK